MMPETYAKLLPVSPQPNYKYASEEAGKFLIKHVKQFLILITFYRDFLGSLKQYFFCVLNI